MREVLVIGGGIAGIESALTLARGLPSDRVTLVSRYPSLRVLPDLVHVPFGVSVHRIDVPLRAALESRGIRVVFGQCDAVDLPARMATIDGVDMPFDVVVVAPGVVEAAPDAGSKSMRTAEGALQLRDELEALRVRPSHAATRVVVRVLSGHNWSPPAAEFALLARTWLNRVAPHVDVTLACADERPLDLLGDAAAREVERLLDEAGVELLQGVPSGRMDAIVGDVNVELRPLEAQRILGLGPRTSSGFYPTDCDGRIAPDAYVVGDAADSPWKAGFATPWQARRVLSALGGDVEVLGREIDGVPSSCFEYQMDAGERTLVIRARCSGHLDAPYLSSRTVSYVTTAPANKLHGTLLRKALLHGTPADAASVQFRRLLHEELPAVRRTAV